MPLTSKIVRTRQASRLRVLESFPMTVSGKVRKVELREQYGA